MASPKLGRPQRPSSRRTSRKASKTSPNRSSATSSQSGSARSLAWVVDNFVGWLIDLFADDIFKPGIAIGGLHTSVGLVYRNSAGWQNFASPPGKFTFVGHGGKYTVDCQWRVEM